MEPAGFIFVGGAAVVFLLMPPFLLFSNATRLEPETRRFLIGIWVVLLVLCAGLYLLIDRWASSGLTS